MKFGSKRAILEVIWGGFEGFGPCLGISHPTNPYLGKIYQKTFFLDGSPYCFGPQFTALWFWAVYMIMGCTKVRIYRRLA